MRFPATADRHGLQPSEHAPAPLISSYRPLAQSCRSAMHCNVHSKAAATISFERRLGMRRFGWTRLGRARGELQLICWMGSPSGPLLGAPLRHGRGRVLLFEMITHAKRTVLPLLIRDGAIGGSK